MSTLSQFDPKGIKSNQSGSVAVFSTNSSQTVTISSVDTAKAFAIFEGVTMTAGYNIGSVRLTSSTQITIGSGGNFSGTLYWRVIELY